MIRKTLKSFIIQAASLYLISLVISGMVFEKGFSTVFLAGAALTITALIIKPVINILLLPLNLITFGLFRWVGYAIALYLVTLIVPGFKIVNFIFSGYSSYWFSIPQLSFNGILAFIAFSFIISMASGLLDWLFE